MNWYDIRSVYRIVNSLYQKEQDLKKIKWGDKNGYRYTKDKQAIRRVYY